MGITNSLHDIEALSATQSVSGYTIHVGCNTYPLNDPNSSQAEVVGDNQEIWPIQLPPGISLEGYHTGVPAGFGATGAFPTNEPFIRFVDAPNANYFGPAKVTGFHFLGGQSALDFDATNGDSPLEVVVKGCTFVRNGVGVDASAVSGVIGGGASKEHRIRIEDCAVKDSHYGLHHPVQYSPCGVGFRFKAEGTTPEADPLLVAEVINLTVSGAFPASIMGAIGPISAADGSDLAGYSPASGPIGHFTRLIEVDSGGTPNRLEFSGAFVQQTIPAVELTVSGGLLDGGAEEGTDRGWDVGIYAMARGHSFGADFGNYTSRYSVTVTGTVLEDLRAAGVYHQVGRDARGQFALNGLTEIRRVGVQSAVQLDDVLSTGVHAVASRGYLVALMDRAFIHDNRGNGVLCFSPVTSIGLLPAGLYLQMTRTGVHQNGRSGIVLDGGFGHAAFPQIAGGTVGGTRDLTLNAEMSLVKHSSKPFYGALPYHGQGTIQGCAISAEGGRYGILCRLRGSSMRPSSPDTLPNFSTASCRIVNTYVWGFALGGYLADLDRAPNAVIEGGPLLLTPIIHSTIVDNPAFSVEIIEQNPVPQYRYYREDPVGGEYLNTMFAHSIFDTRSSSPDFGPNLDAPGNQQWAVDNGQGTHSLAVDQPHVTSIRAVLASGGGGAIPSFTSVVPEYQMTPAGINPDQWYLALSPLNDPLDESAAFLNAGGDIQSEADSDIQGVQRPSLASGLRDKGGEED